MNHKDIALQAVTPTVMVPKFEPFTPLESVGHRYLAAADGLWLEIRRKWLYVRLPVAKQTTVPMPYGTVTEKVEIAFGKMPYKLLNDFVELAKAGLPNEVAAAIIWNEETKELHLQPLEAESASPGHITYRNPILGEGEHLVVDLHSHGTAGAFFSRTDNKDDRGSIKVAGVVGNIDKPEQSYAFRLCALGLFHSL